MIQKRTVGIVGTGQVGVAAAYALFLQRTAGRLILIDKNPEKAEGEALDLMHGQAFAEAITVTAGTYADLAAAQVVIIAAGTGQRPGESRLDLLNRNAAIFAEIAGELDRHAPGAVLIVASNPVDILTHILQQLSRRPDARIIGTGTMLDTARFRALLGRHYRVDPRSVHAYILGEHGDSEVPIWSTAAIGGTPIRRLRLGGRSFDAAEMDRIFERVRDAAYHIISRKGYTSTAIGSAIGRLVEAILEDQRRVLPVSVRTGGVYGLPNVCLSLPCVVGAGGVEAVLTPDLDPDERRGLTRSAAVLQDHLDGFVLPR